MSEVTRAVLHVGQEVGQLGVVEGPDNGLPRPEMAHVRGPGPDPCLLRVLRPRARVQVMAERSVTTGQGFLWVRHP